MKTRIGVYLQDASGLWHYRHTDVTGHVNDAARDAIEYRIGPSWFWFNDTPAPIYNTDDSGSLLERWKAWRKDCQIGSLGLTVLGLRPSS